MSKDVGKDLYQEIVDFSILKPNDDPYLLKNRNKNEKLTKDQIKFLRQIIDSQELNIKNEV